MKLTGYCEPWSATPGDTVSFKVSSTIGNYHADIIQLIHGDANPAGPGVKSKLIKKLGLISATGEQDIRAGSYVEVPATKQLTGLESLTVTLWVFPTLSKGAPQCLMAHQSAHETQGWALVLNDAGAVSFNYQVNNQSHALSCNTPLRLNTWYFVSVRVDTLNQAISLLTQPLKEWLPDDSCGAASARLNDAIEKSSGPLSIGARLASSKKAGLTLEHFNGKLESPAIFADALSDEDIAQVIEAGVDPKHRSLLGAWDFSKALSSNVAVDVSRSSNNGVIHQTPARGVTSHAWQGDHINFADAPEQYAAIKFHEDDLTDAGWQTDFEFEIPADLPSGFYAAKINSGNSEDQIPFFVCPKPGAKNTSTKIAMLAPTMSYLAYANDRLLEGPPAVFTNQDLSLNKESYDYCFKNELKSTYDRHPDGSGVMYSSSRRPLVNMRPGFHHAALGCPHQLPADLHLVDWLHEKSFEHDVITDLHLHRHGLSSLEDYQVVLTGTHPEYWSHEMLDAMQAYLDNGGRLMYLGGNGFYWVTSFLPEADHVMEIRRAFGTRAWESEPGELYHASSGERGGLWRWRGRAPQKMLGIGFTAQGFDNGSPYERKEDSYEQEVAFIFEGVDGKVIGDSPSLVMNEGAAGFELDRYDESQGTPPHTYWLASSANHSNSYQAAVEDIFMSNSMQGGPVNENVRADMTLLTYPSDGAVFSTGSIAWCGSLSGNNYDNDVSKITENVLNRFLENGSTI